MNRFRLQIVIACALYVSSAATLSCFAQSDPQPMALGMVAPLTGDFAPYGIHIQHGIALGVSDLEKRGIHTRLIAEDGCLPAQVRTALTKLTSQDKIAALVGSYCVIGMVASASILENTRTIGFQTSGGTKEILGASDFLLTTAAKTTDEAVALAERAYNKLGLRKAAILYLTTQWGEEFNQAFSKKFQSLGGTITGVATNPIGQNTFRSELAKLRSGEPDVLVIVHLASTLGIAMKQARQSGFRGQFLATSDAEEESVIKEAGKNAEGLVLISPEPEVETEEMRSFEKEFISKFGRQPHPLSRHAYDATILSGTALSECKAEPVCARDRLYQVKEYRGASGIFSINADGGTTRGFVAKIVRAGNFVRE